MSSDAETDAQIRAGMKAAFDDSFPACPRCGCEPGTSGRLLRYPDGSVLCNDCQGWWFVRAETRPVDQVMGWLRDGGIIK
jgi:hypothetical protein